MRWLRLLALVLGSGWFIPVSCTVATIAGTPLVAKSDAREVSRRDTLHSLFKVAAEPGEAGRPFRVLGLSEIAPYIPGGTAAGGVRSLSFRLSASSGTLETGSSTFAYRVLEDNGREQLIELVEDYRDGDNTIWSRYRATRSTVQPVSSRMFYFGYMFQAAAFAFFFALLLYFVGRLMRRTLAASPPDEQAAIN